MLSTHREEEESTEENREDWTTQDYSSIMPIDDGESAMDLLTLLVYFVTFKL